MFGSASVEFDKRTRRLAIVSLGLGIVGLLTAIAGIGVLLAVAAVYTGIVALDRLRPWHPHDGHSLALSGIVLGIATLLSFPLLFATIVPRWITFSQSREHRECFIRLQQIARLKDAWAQAHHATNGAFIDLRASDELAALVQSRCPGGGRYLLKPVGMAPACSITWHNAPPR